MPGSWEISAVTREDELYLYEEIMLLALRGKEGTVAHGAMVNYAVGGAILAELLLSHRVGIEKPRPRKQLVTAVSSESIGDRLIDECLVRIVGAKRRRAPANWVSAFATIRGLKDRVAGHLCRRGILEAEEDNILLFFTRRVYPEIDPEPEQRLVERLSEAIFTDVDDVDPRTVVLVSLANSSYILPVVFGKKQLKARRKRIECIVNGEVTGKAAKDAIAAMQAATTVACMMPAMMASTASH